MVALPVYFSSQLQWEHWQVGGFLALWIIGYGIMQTLAPLLTENITGSINAETIEDRTKSRRLSKGKSAFAWACPLAFIPIIIWFGLNIQLNATYTLVVGLMIFGIFFAINSSLHSYLIVSIAEKNTVSMDVGFYYMANAMGRLIGTLLSGYLFQAYGLEACLIVSSLFIVIAAILALFIDDTYHSSQVK